MEIFPFILQLLGVLFLIFATFNLFPTAKVSWGWAGMACWLASLMITVLTLHPIMGTR